MEIPRKCLTARHLVHLRPCPAAGHLDTAYNLISHLPRKCYSKRVNGLNRSLDTKGKNLNSAVFWLSLALTIFLIISTAWCGLVWSSDDIVKSFDQDYH